MNRHRVAATAGWCFARRAMHYSPAVERRLPDPSLSLSLYRGLKPTAPRRSMLVSQQHTVIQSGSCLSPTGQASTAMAQLEL